MSTINMQQLKKSYEDTQVIHGINIDIIDGEFIVLVGPSGCGKSTLLRMVAGLESISDGEVRIDDVVVNKLEPKDRGIAMVFQNYALYPHMTVYENMAYGLKLMKMPKAEIAQRVQEVAELLQIEQFLQRRPSNLSGGQRQRVAMGRAIVRKPKVFLFDEPLSNLDAKLRVQMRMQIKTLQRNLGVTTLYVTHDQVEAMTMADRLVVLKDGIAAQIGTPMEIYDDPHDQFVAGFIGSPAMNFIDCTITDAQIDIGGQKMPRPAEVTQRGAVVLGIRPEHFANEADKTDLQGQVEMIEKIGASVFLYVKCDNVAELIVIQREGHSQVQIGESVSIDPNPNKLYFFDKNTQQRLY
ncbi:MAG: sn-glycerol-3-phosphate ABC transporter ATP-binding protein UgpC [Pseudomonadales bacterium]|nr:sn-glycerol-3-phosphate ABC transporter ATP-binding protein UgpC [Pseudomonadales bacterium]NRA13986.1 sn-glycerol-3-phosphate ABC transporter ATP-binding protein UgpC [Oceanospirillaceae bacterium]